MAPRTLANPAGGAALTVTPLGAVARGLLLYEPNWAYDAKTLANDLNAHLVYGLATAAPLRALSPRHR